MNWIIPGTTLEGQRENADRTDSLFQSMFLAGGLTLSQVSSITGLESYTIQNWVKRGFLAPPKNKRSKKTATKSIFFLPATQNQNTKSQN